MKMPKELAEHADKGYLVANLLNSIDNPSVFMTIVAACIDCWSDSHGVKAVDVIDEISSAIHEMTEPEIE